MTPLSGPLWWEKPGHLPQETGITEMTSETTETLLEAVLEGVMRAARDPAALLAQLAQDYPSTRAMRLQRVLLMADDTITATFNGEPDARADARATRAAALRLAELADLVEAAGGAPVRLSDLTL